MASELWEILVPQAFNDGHHIPVSHHQVWDEWVRTVAGGLTILKPTKGIWTSPVGEIFREGMIPVRIVCTEAQIQTIIDFTNEHYDQLAVMACRLSDYVLIKERKKTA